MVAISPTPKYREMAKEARIQSILREPPAECLTRECTNPFLIGQGVWSASTGVNLGTIRYRSEALWDKWHWAALEGDFIVFSYEIGTRYLLKDPAKTKPPFHIGQRLFFRSRDHAPTHLGNVAYVYRDQRDTQWVARSEGGMCVLEHDFTHGRISVGARTRLRIQTK